MAEQVRTEHPVQQLMFFISDETDDGSAREMEALVEMLAAARTWKLGPPTFIDEIDQSDNPADDETVRTVGGVLQLYSAVPPWRDRLPVEIDRAHLEEVKSLVQALKSFSARTGHEIEMEMDGNYCGSIQNGLADRSLREGFLGYWDAALKGREA